MQQQQQQLTARAEPEPAHRAHLSSSFSSQQAANAAGESLPQPVEGEELRSDPDLISQPEPLSGNDHQRGSSEADRTDIPLIPYAAREVHMASLLADLHRPAGASVPFWRCPRRLGLIAEINQLRGLPGPRAAAMEVRIKNVQVEPTLCLCIARTMQIYPVRICIGRSTENCVTDALEKAHKAGLPAWLPSIREAHHANASA